MSIIGFLSPFTPWRNSAIPEGALLITKKERDREEEAMRCLKEFAERLQTGQTNWSQAERDKAQEMMEILGPKCPIGDHTADEIVKEMKLNKPGKIAFEGAYQAIHAPAYQAVSKQYQGLFDLVESHDSDQKKRKILYTAFQEDPIAILVCISNPIERANTPGYSKTKSYQLMEYILEKQEEWEKIIKTILEYYQIIGRENVEKLLLPLIEKALAFNFSPAMKKALEEEPGRLDLIYMAKGDTGHREEYKLLAYKKFIRKLMIINSVESATRKQRECIQISQFPNIILKLLEKESVIKHYLLEECRKTDDFENIKIFVKSNRLSNKRLDQLELLHFAVRAGNLSLVKYLINQGLDIDYFRGDLKSNALYHATWHGHFEIAKYLIQKDAKIYSPDRSHDLLNTAINKEWTSILKLLIQSGANPNTYNRNKQTPLYRSIHIKYLEGFKILMQAHANVDFPVTGFNERPDTPLGRALHMLSLDTESDQSTIDKDSIIAKTLMRSGASIFFNGTNLLRGSWSPRRGNPPEEIKDFYSKFHSALLAILENIKNPPLDDSGQYSYPRLRFTLQAVRKAYSWKRHLRCIHEIILEKTRLFPQEDLHAKNLFILIRHLMFLCYGLHPLNAPSWPQELKVNIESPPKDVKEFSTWAEKFIGVLVAQKKFDFTWAQIERLAQFPIEIIERYLLFAWRNRAVSEIKKVIPEELNNYMEHDQCRSFVASRITFKEERDKLESFFEKSLPPAP